MVGFILYAMIFAAAVGFVLGLIGWRGRREGDHPYCRRCGFDLFGKPRESMRCAECGAELSSSHAVRIGLRVRRRAPFATGIAMLAVSLSVMGIATYLAVQRVNITTFLPVWWLAHDARSGVALTRNAAVTELLSRLSAKQLSQSQIDSLSDEFLALQCDLSIAWYPSWGDFIEQAHADALVSEARWKKYAEQSPSYVLKIRPRVRRGDPLPVVIASSGIRAGNRAGLTGRIGAGCIFVRGFGASTRIGTWSMVLSPNHSGSMTRDFTMEDLLGKLKDGLQPARLSFDLEILNTSQRSTPIATKHFDLDGSFELVPSDEQTVSLNRDMSLRGQMEFAVQFSSLMFRPPDQIDVHISVRGAPVGLGYEIFARNESGEHRLGALACAARTPGTTYGTSATWKGPIPTKVDIILRPSTQPAVRSIDVTEIWDGELVIRNVPVGKLR